MNRAILELSYMTPGDRLALQQFDDSGPPTLLVEGEDDVMFFDRLFATQHDLERVGFTIVVCGSKTSVLQFSSEFQFRTLSLVDKDDAVRPEPTDKLFFTHYYSIESYCALEEVVEAFVRDRASSNHRRSFSFPHASERIRRCLAASTCLSIVKQQTGTSSGVAPPHTSGTIWSLSERASLEPRLQEVQQKVAEFYPGMSAEAKVVMCEQAQLEASALDFAGVLRITCGKHVLDALHRYLEIDVATAVLGIRSYFDFFWNIAAFVYRSAEGHSLLAWLRRQAIPV